MPGRKCQFGLAQEYALRRIAYSPEERTAFDREWKTESRYAGSCPQIVAARLQHFATAGTSRYLSENGIENQRVLWPSEVENLAPDSPENALPRALDLLRDKKIDMVVNVHKNFSTGELTNGYKIRRAAIDFNIPLLTNARLASAFIYAFTTTPLDSLEIKSWQEF